MVVRAIKRERLSSVMRAGAGLVNEAKPDSLWQMTMLAGALSVAPLVGTLVSYQVPTYYGMLCAGFARSKEPNASSYQGREVMKTPNAGAVSVGPMAIYVYQYAPYPGVPCAHHVRFV